MCNILLLNVCRNLYEESRYHRRCAVVTRLTVEGSKQSIETTIARIRSELLPPERISFRKSTEDRARDLLVKNLGNINVGQLDEAFREIDGDFWDGERRQGRFGWIVAGKNKREILANDLTKLNKFVLEVFGNENLTAVDDLIRDLNFVGYGVASILLYLRNPEKYNVFLRKRSKALKLVFPDARTELDYFGRDYPQYNAFATKLRERFGLAPQEVDLVLTDLYGSLEPPPPEKPSSVSLVPPIARIATHEDAEGVLLELGNALGFDAYTADPAKEFRGKRLSEIASLLEVPSFTFDRLLRTAKEIDVIWFEEGFPAYCFEVEHTTGVRDGLLRLFNLRQLNAKFFIVALGEVITKFQTEVMKDPFYQLKERYIFRSYEQLIGLYQDALKYHQARSEFGID